MIMEARDVLEILGLFERAEVTVWIEGGWGIDALVGTQNRDHGDVDVMVDVAHGEAARQALSEAGFVVIYDDAPGHYSFMDGANRHVDVTITTADRYGDRWTLNRIGNVGDADYPADGFRNGWIGGRQVSCVGPETQVQHHLGYEIETVDRSDIALLCNHFAVGVPDALR